MTINNAIDDYESLKLEFLNESIMIVEEESELDGDIWTLYFVGVVNVLGSSIGLVLISHRSKQFHISIKLQFKCNNNIVKCEAYRYGLEAVLKMKVWKLGMYGDSLLIIC